MLFQSFYILYLLFPALFVHSIVTNNCNKKGYYNITDGLCNCFSGYHGVSCALSKDNRCFYLFLQYIYLQK